MTHEPKLGIPQQCLRCGGFNPSGFIDPDDCRWCGMNKPKSYFSGPLTDPIPKRVRLLEERVAKLEALIHKNLSGCCCVFDEDGETIIKSCLAHRKWKEDK